jgi:hypothetical protein
MLGRYRVPVVRILIVLLGAFGLVMAATPQEHARTPSSSAISETILAAVSRDSGLLRGGIGPGSRTKSNALVVEPFVRTSETGQFSKLPCQSEETKGCKEFARQYLSKPHIYGIISPDGYGATVRAGAATLDECFDYVGNGTYAGARLDRSAVASAMTEMFVAASPLMPLSGSDAAALGKLLKLAVGEKLDSAKNMRSWSVNLAEHNLIVVQRAYEDVPGPDNQRARLVFMIGEVEGQRLHVLHWKQNTDDEEERVLGTIKLRSGQDFLVSVVSHPEGHFFRIYGFQQNELRMVFQGGGSSC